MTHARIVPTLIVAMLAGAACNSSPGRPGPGSAIMPPDQILDFNILYGQNCAGCHGVGGNGGAAIALRDPVFLAVADDQAIRKPTSNGVHGTEMPAFAQSAAGMLSDKQIDALVSGIRSWAQTGSLRGANPPPNAAKTPGDGQDGAEGVSDLLRPRCISVLPVRELAFGHFRSPRPGVCGCPDVGLRDVCLCTPRDSDHNETSLHS